LIRNIYSSPTLSRVYTPLKFHSNVRFSLKYARYAFLLSSHLSLTLAELKSTPNITTLAAYPNMCMTQEATKT
jgi:uncharacterized protein VirK/YbjX